MNPRHFMTALTVAATGLIGLQVLAVSPSGAAESDGGMGSYCSIAGSIAQKPGIGYEAKATAYELTGTMDCTSEELSHGTVTGNGTGTTGCFGGSSAAVLKIVWDNGAVSTVSAQLGDFGYGTGGYGTVTEGMLKDSHVGLGWGRYAAGGERRCASGQVKSYEFAGYTYFHTHSGH
jgi:hypothetical protein